MLELKSIEWQNFLSYGDYPTKLDLDCLGQCLVTGEIINEDSTNIEPLSSIRKSNGCGKSTIPNVIQWALFGRTMHSRAPGDNVVNFFTGKDCWAKLIFKNGDMILRTRKTCGSNELIYMKDGDEHKSVANTVSTSTTQQQALNKAFKLDWEIFCGSVFFNQYGRPWMEMADTTRKKAIERVLHVDRLTYYAQAAKSRCDNYDKVVENTNNQIKQLKSNLETYKKDKQNCVDSFDIFESSRSTRKKQISESIDKVQQAIEDMCIPDKQSLSQKWEIVNKIKEKISEYQKKLLSINSNISSILGDIRNLEDTIRLWNSKSGKMCAACEQSVDSSHVSSKLDPVLTALEGKKNDLETAKSERTKVSSIVDNSTALLDAKTPDITLADIDRMLKQRERLELEILGYKKQLSSIDDEPNPHAQSIGSYDLKIKETTDKITALEDELTKSEYLNKHFHYIFKSYNDRSKIKGFIFREHVPYINARLKYYLEVFDLDLKIELTDSLGITSSMWGYEYESGGERKRTDIAFMLAMFDFHEQIYGRQCNILVMDEVDGRLDDDGIDALINIVKNDLAHRVESIIIISHRNMMFDTFSNEVKVRRSGRFSYLDATYMK
jgi:DNA repair exonuclease SbcCD ATPase subunit